MRLIWTCESPAFWDDDKARVLESARPAGILPGVWWRVSRGDYAVAYGWMDVVWGEAEILLAVAPEARGIGIGSLVLDGLEAEAARRGLSYLHNTVRPDHPERERVLRWLTSRGFQPSADGGRLVRRVHRVNQGRRAA